MDSTPPLFFANAPYLQDQVKRSHFNSGSPVRCLLLDTEAIPDIDTTAADNTQGVASGITGKEYVTGNSPGK